MIGQKKKHNLQRRAKRRQSTRDASRSRWAGERRVPAESERVLLRQRGAKGGHTKGPVGEKVL